MGAELHELLRACTVRGLAGASLALLQLASQRDRGRSVARTFRRDVGHGQRWRAVGSRRLPPGQRRAGELSALAHHGRGRGEQRWLRRLVVCTAWLLLGGEHPRACDAPGAALQPEEARALASRVRPRQPPVPLSRRLPRQPPVHLAAALGAHPCGDGSRCPRRRVGRDVGGGCLEWASSPVDKGVAAGARSLSRPERHRPLLLYPQRQRQAHGQPV